MKKYDYLIVGSGLYGACFAQRAVAAGKRVLVIDKREHLGGNLYCDNVEGINVHTYGPHIFHTSNEKVWEFVNSLTPFKNCIYSPIANYKGRLYNLPFNMNTFSSLWDDVTTPQGARDKINAQKRESGITEPQNLEEQAISLVGREVYETLIKGYTEKQWGRDCTELPAYIIRRLPVRFTFDNNYFNDKYQGIPIGGYNKLINAMLDGAETMCGVDYFANREHWDSIAERVLFTGKIDEYFDYCYGKLEYRTVRFEQEIVDTPNYQGVAVTNYTDRETPYTRVIEHKHFETFGADLEANPKSVISREYSVEWSDGMEPYYPINNERNDSIYAKYKQKASELNGVIFGGRLAEYKYYDMAPIIEKILNLENV